MLKELYTKISLSYETDKITVPYSELQKICVTGNLKNLTIFLDMYFLDNESKDMDFNKFKKLTKKLKSKLTEEVCFDIIILNYICERESINSYHEAVGVLGSDLEDATKNIELKYLMPDNGVLYLVNIWFLYLVSISKFSGVKFKNLNSSYDLNSSYQCCIKFLKSKESYMKAFHKLIMGYTELPIGSFRKFIDDVVAKSADVNLKFNYTLNKYFIISLLLGKDDKDFSKYVTRFDDAFLIGTLGGLVSKESISLDYIQTITDEGLRMLRKSKIILPRNGVNISGIGYYDIKNIVLKYKFLSNGDYCLVAYYTYDTLGGFDNSVITLPMLINITKGFMVGINGLSFDVLNIIVNYMGMDSNGLDVNKYRVYDRQNNTVDASKLNKLVPFLHTTFDRSEKPTYIPFEIYSDTMRYTVTNIGECKQDSGEMRDISNEEKVEYTKEVGHFPRRLPEGAVMSERAKELANKYFVDVPDGFTLVSPSIRVYHKEVK